MAGEMFGAAVGVQNADQDYRADFKTSIDSARELGQIAMQPAQQRLIEAHAGKAEMDLDAERRMSALMQEAQGQSGGKPVSMADQLDSLAQKAARAGLVTKAMDLSKNAALIRTREMTALAAGARLNETQLDVVRKQANTIGQLFGGVKDEASWNRANALYQFQTGQRSPYSGIPYDADLVTSINQQALTAKERADALGKTQSAQALLDFRNGRLTQHDTMADIAERRLELARQREARLAKAGGGKGVSGPAKSEIEQAQLLLKKDYANMDAADSQDAAYSIAAEARALRRANPALDANAAMQQALSAAVEAGDFQTGTGILGTGLKAKTTFTGRGKSVLMPLPVPKDSKAMIKDRYYTNGKGVVAKWNGSKFVIGGGATATAAEPDDEEADDTETADEE